MKSELWLGDCLELLQDIPSASTNLILFDPPYGANKIACALNDGLDLPKLWEQLHRIVIPFGTIAIFCTQPFTTDIINSNRSEFKYCWVWTKNRPTCPVHARNRPMGRHEDIAVFSAGKIIHITQGAQRMYYDPQGVIDRGEGSWSQPILKRKPGVLSNRENQIGKVYGNKTGYPNTILEYLIDEPRIHPSQKPVALLEFLIKTYCPPNGKVVDPTCGIASVGVACAQCGREYIGIDSDPQWLLYAAYRIANAEMKE